MIFLCWEGGGASCASAAKTNLTSVLSMSLDGRLEVFLGRVDGGEGGGGRNWSPQAARQHRRDRSWSRDASPRFWIGPDKTLFGVLPKTVTLGFFPLFCSIVNCTLAAAGSDVFFSM